jgi:hypothetical protein
MHTVDKLTSKDFTQNDQKLIISGYVIFSDELKCKVKNVDQRSVLKSRNGFFF